LRGQRIFPDEQQQVKDWIDETQMMLLRYISVISDSIRVES